MLINICYCFLAINVNYTSYPVKKVKKLIRDNGTAFSVWADASRAPFSDTPQCTDQNRHKHPHRDTAIAITVT